MHLAKAGLGRICDILCQIDQELVGRGGFQQFRDVLGLLANEVDGVSDATTERIFSRVLIVAIPGDFRHAREA